MNFLRNKKNALLIIDMQQGSFTADTPRYDTIGVVKRINSLAELFRNSGHQVIFIQHDGSMEKTFIPGTAEWQILPSLASKTSDIFISKIANDCFYESKLQRRLKKLAINDLVITGCATDFCVEATVQSAVAKDYNVIVVKDGHTTGGRPHLDAGKIIQHYNWIWQNMIPTKGSLKVMSYNSLKKEFFPVLSV